MNTKTKSYLYLHTAVFLFGFTGILGQIISLQASSLIWWRCIITSFLMLPLLIYYKSFRDINFRSIKIFSGIGIILGMHWLCFYGSIKLANASVAMICLSTISVMTVFFEALFNKQRIVKQDMIIGMLVIPGILLINQSLRADFKLGFWVGILCSVFSAIVASLNKKYMSSTSSLAITWIEISIVAILFSIINGVDLIFFSQKECLPNSHDWFYLFILSFFCTLIPLTLAVKSMRNLSAFSTMLVFNLETVYGIILSIIILKEHKELNWMFYIGVLIILSSVFAYPFFRKYKFLMLN
ncbi:MAG: DMT family transporter [Saprospiraceae bacterium]